MERAWNGQNVSGTDGAQGPRELLQSVYPVSPSADTLLWSGYEW